MNPLRRETLAKHPDPPATPLEALAHVLAIYEDSPDERVVITATTRIYSEAPWTGLRLGDLRALLNDHAHELAEKIRNSERLRDYTDDHMGDCNMAADLIDPTA